MRNVYDCVEAFGKLLDKEYHLVLSALQRTTNTAANTLAES